MPKLNMAALEAMVEAHQKILEEEVHVKYIHLYETTIKFLQRESVLLYGGTAINSILPVADKFYGVTELPDLDLFATDAKLLATRLANHFRGIRDMGQEVHAVTVRPALHPGTWRVKVDGADIADLTEVSIATFKKLQRNSRMGDIGLRVANIDYLRMTLYTLLAQPVDVHRWLNVYERLGKFNKNFPIKFKPLQAKKKNILTKARVAKETPTENVVISALKRHNLKYVVILDDASLQKAGILENGVKSGVHGVFLLVEGDPRQAAQRLLTRLERADYQVDSFRDADEFVPASIVIRNHAGIVATLFATTPVCLSYSRPFEQKYGYRMVSLQTLIKMLYAMRFSTLFLSNAKTSALIQSAMAFQDRHSDMVDLLSTECYGQQPRMFTLRKEQFLRNRRPIHTPRLS